MVVVLAILPIFGLITLGYLFGWRQWLTNEGAAGLASVTFKLFMPAVLFTGIARAELSDGMSPMLLLGYFVPVLLVFLLVNTVAHRRAGRATPLGLTAAYSNNVLVGIPLVTTLLGAESRYTCSPSWCSTVWCCFRCRVSMRRSVMATRSVFQRC